jgi:predicted nuclease of predicted toxin-antitoxin system
VRVLLDECVDRRLAQEILGHDVNTVPELGWAGLTNGELLAHAEREFDVFVTVDGNLPFQQPLARFPIAVVVLRARSNRLTDLRDLIPQLLAALPSAKPGEVTWVERLGT